MSTLESSARLYVKSYFADSIEEAMDQARKELGADALLLNTREAPPEARHLGECEAVFGVRPCGAGVASGVPESPGDPVEDLRQRFEELRQLVARAVPAPRPGWPGPAIASALRATGITRGLAAEIEAAVEQRLRGRPVVEIGRGRSLSSRSAEEVVREMIAEMESRFETAPEAGRITALVGPAGAGKTSALVKLAIHRGLSLRRPARLLSLDHYRIAAADQLRTYAGILGAPFTLVETTAGLAEAIDAAPAGALILIDTPGYAPAAAQEFGQDVAAFLRDRQDIDTHLVLPATTRQADLERAVDRFRAFGPRKLLFTRLDETDSTAAMFCEAARTGLPLSFVSTGPMIPEDLEDASKARITSRLAQELPEALQAAA